MHIVSWCKASFVGLHQYFNKITIIDEHILILPNDPNSSSFDLSRLPIFPPVGKPWLSKKAYDSSSQAFLYDLALFIC